MTASLGLAFSPPGRSRNDHGARSRRPIKALYQAKADGRNCVVSGRTYVNDRHPRTTESADSFEILVPRPPANRDGPRIAPSVAGELTE